MSKPHSQRVEKLSHHDQVGFTLRMQGWFSLCKSINVLHQENDHMIKKSYDHLNRHREKHLTKFIIIFDKTFQQTGYRGNVHQHSKGHI